MRVALSVGRRFCLHFVLSELLVEDKCRFPTGIQYRVWSVVLPEDLCHVINGGTGRSFKQGHLRAIGEARLLDSLCVRGYEEVVGPRLGEGEEEGVVSETDLLGECGPPRPASSPLVLCGGISSLFAGSLSSME